MSRRTGRHVLPFFYLVSVSAVYGLLILLGYAVDRVPLLPASVTRRYQRFMLALVSGLARPVDGWTGQPPDPVAGGVAGESAP